VTLDAPYHALVSLGFLVVSLSRCANLEVTVFLLFVHAAGLFSMFSLGHVRVTSDRALERLEREREAVAANLLAQSHSTAARLERELTEVLGAHHDARNLLTNAVLASRGLQRRLLTGDGAPPDVALIQASLGKIDSALALVTSLFHQSTSRGMAGAPFDASPVIRAQLADFHSRRPAVTLHVAALPGASLDLPGGPTTFRRILDNLLLNAAEGDGTRGAHNLWLEATPEDGRLHLRLSDDGPGFPAEVLTSSRQRFTLKKDGSGLGLLTVDSLVRACSGVLQLSNRTRGGAQVDVFLPLHAPPDQGAQEATA
jgi:signal transduction histidine kinase